MPQKLVVWSVPLMDETLRNDLDDGFLGELDLSYESLAPRYPDLARAIGGWRVVDHTYSVVGSNRIYTFVVER